MKLNSRSTFNRLERKTIVPNCRKSIQQKTLFSTNKEDIIAKLQPHNIELDDRRKFLLNLFETKSPIAKYFGMKLLFNKSGDPIIYLPINKHLDNAWGSTHGGYSPN